MLMFYVQNINLGVYAVSDLYSVCSVEGAKTLTVHPTSLLGFHVYINPFQKKAADGLLPVGFVFLVA